MMTTKKLIVVPLAAVAMLGARADTQKIDGVTWSYYEYYLTEEEVGADEGLYVSVTGASPAKGKLSVPAELGGLPVGRIETDAFADNNAITEVVFPESLRQIGEDAFNDCQKLERVVFNEGLVTIGYDAFCDCVKLGNVTIPSTVTEGIYFPFAYPMTAITVAEGNPCFKSIDGVVYSKDGSRLVFVPSGRTGEWTVPGHVTEIGDEAFAGGSLSGVAVHAGVSKISEVCPFIDCFYLTHISVAGGNANYNDVDGVLFSADGTCLLAYPAGKGGVSTYTVPQTVTRLGKAAFSGSSLSGVVFPSTILSLPEEMFVDCAKLTSVIIGAGCETVEKGAFYCATKLESITLPASVKSIGRYAFEDCYSLKAVFCPVGAYVADDPSEYDPSKKIDYSSAATVKFDLNYDGAPEYRYDRNVVDGQPVGILTAPERPGYRFVGWFTGKDGGTKIDATTKVTANVAYYAHWHGQEDGYGPFIVGEKVEVDVGLLGYAAKGLPSGLKYDAKKGTVSGAAKAAGEYEVTFTKNGEKDEAALFSVREEEVSIGCAGLSGGSFTAGVAGNADGIALEIASETGEKSVAVSKLPAGMKYDAKTGFITGAPTKPGDYGVVIAVTTQSGAKRTETIPVSVAALPDNVVGTFNGFIKAADGDENAGTFQLTATDAGKLTAKVTAADGSYSFGGTCWDKVEGGVYSATLATKKGETLTLALDSTAGWNENQLTGSFAPGSSRPPCQVVARKNAFGKTWYFDAEGNERDGWRLSYAENAKAAALAVTLNADGSTKIAGKLGALSVSASGYADVTRLSEGAIIADFAPVVSVKIGKSTLKRVLSIGANLWFDRSNEHPYIGSVYLQ